MTESICPHCGLVIAADPARAAVWLAEHVVKFHGFPERAAFTAIGCLPSGAHYILPPVTSGRVDIRLVSNPPLAFTWGESISVQDAEWLHELGISPL